MQRGNHKRVRSIKETNGFSSALSNGTHANHENKASWGPSKSSAASDPFVIPNLLERLADGKYGSVTKEYESLHGRVSSFLSALRYSVHGFNTQNVPRPCPPSSELGGTPADANKDSEPLAEEIASFHGQALGQESGIGDTAMQIEMPELPSPQDPITRNGDCHAPIIVIDSDDDMEPQEDQNAHQSGDEPLAIQLWQPDHPNVTHESYQGACLDLCNHGSTFVGVVGWQPSIQYQKVDLMNLAGNCPYPDLVGAEQATPLLSPFSITSNKIKGKGRGRPKGSVNSVKRKTKQVNADGVNLDASQSEKAIPSGKGDASEGLEPDDSQPQSPNIESPAESDPEVAENDGLGDLWQEMSLAMEFSKTVVSDEPESDDEDECEHLFVMKDDLGVVCRVCGIIQKSIEKIVDYQLTKSSRATRVYSHESRHNKDSDGNPSLSGPKAAEHDLFTAEIAIHPRHEKEMKPHQLEGFCFLVRNLVTDKPGGCILAHAPGSGKTFMLISFLQSFLAKYPFARPLVVLPKGILAIWKKEFGKWQVEDIPLYDFYSVKADNRSQQLEVLKNWEDNKSILLMGYKQFANIVCGGIVSEVAAACQERLLKVPSLLIIDEGHTPRNDNTDVLMALSRVETPRKVVLSGTLFQNHVKEVFNILNLVRPKFLKMESSRAVVTRIMSRVRISGSRRVRPDVNTSFYELVEETLQCESDLKRKVAIIRDLREMTQHVLHYYKGDFLEELPGLVDFTVMLKLSARQKQIIHKLGKLDKFKRSAVCRAIYMHPSLNEISENVTGNKSCDLNEEKIDNIIGNLDIRDGVKTKFFLNVLFLCLSAGEKLLVFSQYLLPLKFLERLVAGLRGWRSGREMFMISGDSSPDQRESAMEQFNRSVDAKLFFGSIKACGEGISLVGASRVIILDVHLNPSVSRQAIGRAFRPGQSKKVHVYRLVAADSAEEEDHNTSFRKELTSKMWFEWSEYSHNQDFEMEKVDIEDSEDMFFERSSIAEDVSGLYRR